jgi:chromatin structure-remodeling complex subunit RSC4
MYPDYYTIIKKPIALDKIKSQLDTGEYQSLFAVKNDLDQCFRNAKRYNLKESQIFNDAKFLHVGRLLLHSSILLFPAQKLTSREYVNMTGDTKDDAEGHNEDHLQEDGHETGLKDGVEEEPKKKKTMARLLTVRMDKLVAKKDDACVFGFLGLLFSLNMSVVETLYRTTLWNYPTRRSGPSITRRYPAQ